MLKEIIISSPNKWSRVATCQGVEVAKVQLYNGIHPIHKGGCLTIGWYVKEEHRKQGLAYKLAADLLVEETHAVISRENEASIALSKKLGFKKVATNLYKWSL